MLSTGYEHSSRVYFELDWTGERQCRDSGDPHTVRNWSGVTMFGLSVWDEIEVTAGFWNGLELILRCWIEMDDIEDVGDAIEIEDG